MPPQVNASSTTGDLIRRVREDIMRGEYHTALSNVTALLGEIQDSNPKPVLNDTQRLRLHLLRCDCYSGLRAHVKALEEARTAIGISNALSPQAYFQAGRELYRLGNMKEALEHFDMGETLISSGVGISEIAPGDMDRATNRGGGGTLLTSSTATSSTTNTSFDDDALAYIGIDPAAATAIDKIAAAQSDKTDTTSNNQHHHDKVQQNPPIVPSFEWVQDLEQWRRYHAEAHMMHQMTLTHVVPARLATQAIQYVCKDALGSGRSSQVIVIRNTTIRSNMRFAYHEFDGCNLSEPFVLPKMIKPGEVAIAVVSGSSWMGGSRGTIAYSLEMSSITAGFVFETPMMSDYAAAVWLRSGKAFVDPNNMVDVKPKPRTSASEEISLNRSRFKALVSQVGRVVTFALTEVQLTTLTTSELVGVLEFLPPAVLRKCTAASWHLRDVINHLPPQMFYTPPTGTSAASCAWYPNYVFPSDFCSSPWTIRGTTDVTWNIVFEGLERELENYCVQDAYDNRVLSLSLDLQTKGFSATVYYGSGKRRQQVGKVSEGWNLFSKPVAWKLNNGRKLGSVSVGATEVTVAPESSPDSPVLSMRRGPNSDLHKQPIPPGRSGGSSTTSHSNRIPTLVIARVPTGEVVAEVYFRKVALSSTKRGDFVAELVMKPGCDAFLAGVLATFGRTKWTQQ